LNETGSHIFEPLYKGQLSMNGLYRQVCLYS